MLCDSCEKQPGCRTLPVKMGENYYCSLYAGPEARDNACRTLAGDMRALSSELTSSAKYLKEVEETHKGCIADSGQRTEFPTGAVRDMHAGKGRMDLLPWAAIVEVSKHCEEGALKYGERNIDKGLPLHSLLDSGMRHLAKYLEGAKDEPHLRSAAWNILWAIQFELTMPEMQDIPNRKEKI